MMTLLLAAALLAQEDFGKKVDDLLPRLAAEEIKDREPAVRELHRVVDAAGPTCRAALKARRDAATDASLKAIFDAALKRLPVLELKIQPVGVAWVGHPVTFDVRIKNVSDEEVAVVRSLDGSDVRMRYPYFTADLRDLEGKLIPPRGTGRCGNCNPLTERDFQVLKPGGEFNPLGSGSFGMYQLSKIEPTAPGMYVIQLTVDYSAADSSLWNGPDERDIEVKNKVLKLLERVPKVKLVAKAVIDVKE